MPYLSVIVPAYNSEATLERCVRSVLDQSFVDLELIIVDDGSSDSTPALLRQFSEEDGRVRVFTQVNSGVSAARNLGLNHAQGTYVAFLDADDWVDPRTYEKLTSAMKESGASCAACGYYLAWPDGKLDFGAAPMDTGVYGGEEVLRRLADWQPLVRKALRKVFPLLARVLTRMTLPPSALGATAIPERLCRPFSRATATFSIASGFPIGNLWTMPWFC